MDFDKVNNLIKTLLEGEKDTSRVDKFGELKSAIDEIGKSSSELEEKHQKLVSDYLALSSKINFPTTEKDDGSPRVFNEDTAFQECFNFN